LVASTGIIGRRLPLAKITAALPELVKRLSKDGIAQAKKAILTTDTFSKEASVRLNIGGRIVNICGIAKGAGMIAVDMATMLGFIFTDANITRQALNKALKIAAAGSFNSITVDGCMSTNDMVILLANGRAGNHLIDNRKNFSVFSRGLNMVCRELARMIVQDAEGATKFIEIEVKQAKNAKEAKRVALSIANSNLFKTAMFASSKNVFGRIVAAAGSSGIAIKEDKLKVKFSRLNKKEVKVEVALGSGKASAVVYTSDLTYEYVKINAEYN